MQIGAEMERFFACAQNDKTKYTLSPFVILRPQAEESFLLLRTSSEIETESKDRIINNPANPQICRRSQQNKEERKAYFSALFCIASCAIIEQSEKG